MLKFAPIFCLFIQLIQGQNPSPCPEIFSYEPPGREEDRWYGVISLQTHEDLDGVWLKITLDRQAELLGNWFGEASSVDNQEFTVKNSRYKLEAGPPVSVRFFVKYNAAYTTPSVKTIKLNGKTICTANRQENISTTPKLHISQIRPVTSTNRPNNKPIGKPASNNNGGAFLNNREPNEGERRPTNNEGTTLSYQTVNRRPTGSSQSNTQHTNINQREQSGTNSNGLSVEEDTSPLPNDFDYFPGDFALHSQSPKRPQTRPSILNKRNVACGTVAMKASPLISYGQNTTQGQWPWHAALYHTQGAQLMYTCGATLIAESYILTAAHCVAKPQSNRPIDTKRLSVYLGKYSLKKFGSGTQDREVSDIYIHPQYNYSVYFNDIAILKLKSPVDITNYVRPCCLWEGNNDIEYVLNKLGTVVGWGFDENRQISDTLMQAQMPIVSTVNCIYSNREFFSQFTFEKTYCAGFRNDETGTTVCNGDSGGGMVFPKSGTSGLNTVWQIRGIVSVGVALQGQGVCDPSHYIVFTDVAKHLDWIRQVMNE